MKSFQSPGYGVVQTAFFSDSLCDALIEEAEQICSVRNETMAQTGLHLNKHNISFAQSAAFCQCVAGALVKAGLLRPGTSLTCTTAFMIRYGQEESHEIHADDSDITLNVCLGGKFDQANLFFGHFVDHE
jgi:hypothetical protein